jgi:hypothetical protein
MLNMATGREMKRQARGNGRRQGARHWMDERHRELKAQ